MCSCPELKVAILLSSDAPWGREPTVASGPLCPRLLARLVVFVCRCVSVDRC